MNIMVGKDGILCTCIFALIPEIVDHHLQGLPLDALYFWMEIRKIADFGLLKKRVFFKILFFFETVAQSGTILKTSIIHVRRVGLKI